MKTDAQLKADISNELQWDPAVDATHIGVAVKDGVVTLTGHLDTYAEKFAVERAVQRVEGVRALAIELDVKLAPGHRRSDSEIAEAIEHTLRWNVAIPHERIRIQVEKGWVSLAGDVDWEFQRRSAERAVRQLTGVVGVSNGIAIKAAMAQGDVSTRIRQALSRHAERQARHIEVSISGSTVTLRGHVDSWPEREAAQGAAWSAPGVSLVVNELRVGPAA